MDTLWKAIYLGRGLLDVLKEERKMKQDLKEKGLEWFLEQNANENKRNKEKVSHCEAPSARYS